MIKLSKKLIEIANQIRKMGEEKTASLYNVWPAANAIIIDLFKPYSDMARKIYTETFSKLTKDHITEKDVDVLLEKLADNYRKTMSDNIARYPNSTVGDFYSKDDILKNIRLTFNKSEHPAEYSPAFNTINFNPEMETEKYRKLLKSQLTGKDFKTQERILQGWLDQSLLFFRSAVAHELDHAARHLTGKSNLSHRGKPSNVAIELAKKYTLSDEGHRLAPYIDPNSEEASPMIQEIAGVLKQYLIKSNSDAIDKNIGFNYPGQSFHAIYLYIDYLNSEKSIEEDPKRYAQAASTLAKWARRLQREGLLTSRMAEQTNKTLSSAAAKSGKYGITKIPRTGVTPTFLDNKSALSKEKLRSIHVFDEEEREELIKENMAEFSDMVNGYPDLIKYVPKKILKDFLEKYGEDFLLGAVVNDINVLDEMPKEDLMVAIKSSWKTLGGIILTAPYFLEYVQDDFKESVINNFEDKFSHNLLKTPDIIIDFPIHLIRAFVEKHKDSFLKGMEKYPVGHLPPDVYKELPEDIKKKIDESKKDSKQRRVYLALDNISNSLKNENLIKEYNKIKSILETLNCAKGVHNA